MPQHPRPSQSGRERPDRRLPHEFASGVYRARKRQQEQAEQQRQRRFYEQARQHARQQREDQERRDRQRARHRARAHQPPPHAGTSRPHTFCGACGGLRAEHTYHHDDAAHERARRRYEGLRAKAASTSYPHEADACHAKAEQLRDKYGL